MRIVLVAVLGVLVGYGGSVLADGHGSADVPQTGEHLRQMHFLAFGKYLLGVYDGQAALVKALGVEPVVCLAPLANREHVQQLAGFWQTLSAGAPVPVATETQRSAMVRVCAEGSDR